MGVKLQESVGEAAESRCFSGNLAWLLYKAHWALASELTAGLAPLGVSARGYHVLRAALSGAHTQTELAEMVGLDKTTMVVTVDALEAAGLAERRPSSHDRRARVVAVTKVGESKVREAEVILERVRDDVLEALDPAERKPFLNALRQLAGGRLADPVPCAHSVRRRV